MDKKYLNFPVPMLKELHTDRASFFHNVFAMGVYLYSSTLTGSDKKRNKDALDYLGITMTNSDRRMVEAGNKFRGMPPKCPIVGIDKDMLFDFYKNEKSDFDIICLAAFLGTRSIIGKKPYTKTNKAMIHARMFGYASPKDLPKKLDALQNKYKVRWHMDKVLQELEMNWYLRTISNHVRGMYVSFDLSIDELALKSEESKHLTKIQQYREMKRKAVVMAKEHFTTH